MDFYAKTAELVRQGKPFAVATVFRVDGSSSARRGSKAIINAEGKLILGWVGGGCAESAVRSEALRCLELGQPLIVTLDMTDELLGVGMPTPEEIALSIMSQIVALRRGGTNQPLHLKGAIAEEGASHFSDKVLTQCDAPSADRTLP